MRNLGRDINQGEQQENGSLGYREADNLLVKNIPMGVNMLMAYSGEENKLQRVFKTVGP